MSTDVMISSHPFHTGIALAATTYKSVHSSSKANKTSKKGSLKKKRRKGSHKSKGNTIRRTSNSTDRGSEGHVKGEETVQSDASVDLIVVHDIQKVTNPEIRKSKSARSDIKSATKGIILSCNIYQYLKYCVKANRLLTVISVYYHSLITFDYFRN